MRTVLLKIFDRLFSIPSSNIITVKLTPDQAIVLFEFFWRFQETDELAFANAAEYLALSAIAGQLEETLVEPFMPNYDELLATARERLAGDLGSDYPGPKTQPTT